jgi:protein O-GlcNAc transferase
LSVPAAVEVVRQALRKGNFGRADILSRHMREALPGSFWPPLLLAETALGIGEIEAAQSWATEARRRGAEAELTRLEAKLEHARPVPRSGGYLLIKCWGYGLWSDVEHVLASLLLAEMTGRIPVVLWGENSFYIDDGTDEAFGTLFEPIAPLTLAELSREGDIYPPKYRRDTLDAVGLNIWDGPYSRLSGLYLLNRPERVVVSDFFTQVAELLPWLHRSHWLASAGVMDAIRRLYAKYLVPAADIKAGIDAFTAVHFGQRPVLGVHVRNIDKALEDPAVAKETRDMNDLVDRYMAQAPHLRLFLLTDTEAAVRRYRNLFGDRVFLTDSARTDGLVPLT